MSNLTILSKSIRTSENLFSLTDLHKACGGEVKHKPTFFLRLEQTQALITEIESDPELQICNSVKIIHGGMYSGTYACEEIALAYAMWISPKFHLIVLRAFIAMHRGEKQTAKQLPKPERPSLLLTTEEVENIVDMYFAVTRYQESVYHLTRSLKDFRSRQLDSVKFNYDVCQRHINLRLPTIQKIVANLQRQQLALANF